MTMSTIPMAAVRVFLLTLLVVVRADDDEEINCDDRGVVWAKLDAFGADGNTGDCSDLAHMADVEEKESFCVPTNSWYECNGFIANYKEEENCASELEVECWIGKTVQNSITGGTITTPCREIDMDPSTKKLTCESTEVIAALHVGQKKARCCPLVGYPPVTTPVPPTTAESTTAEPTTAEPTTAEPTTAEPTTAESTTAEPATGDPDSDQLHCHESASEWAMLDAFGASTTAGQCNSLAFMADVDDKVKECVPTNAWYECNGFIEKLKEKDSCASNLEVECWIGKTVQNSITGGTITTPCREIDMDPSTKKLTCESTEAISALHIADKKAKCCPLVGYPPVTTPAPPTTATPQPTTAEPTTAEPTTAGPTTAEPTTAEPMTAEPTTAEPTTAEPTTAEPTTAEPTTAESTTAEPTTAEPTTAESTTAEPTTAQPTTAEPTTAEPTTADITTAEPTTAEPTTAEPTTAEPTTEPTTAEPTAEPTTAEPTTVEPATGQTTAQPTTVIPPTTSSPTAVPTTPEPTANESIPLNRFKLQVAFEMLIEAVPIPALEATMAQTLHLHADESVKVLSVTPASVLVVFVVITRSPAEVVKRTTEEAIRNPSHPLSKDFLAIDGSVALTAEPPKRLPLSGYMLFGFVAVVALSVLTLLIVYIHRRRSGALKEKLPNIASAATAVKSGRLLIDGRCITGERPPEDDNESVTELTAATVTWSGTSTTDSRSAAASRTNGYRKKSPLRVQSTAVALTDSDDDDDSRAFIRPCDDGRDGQVAEFLGVDAIVHGF